MQPIKSMSRKRDVKATRAFERRAAGTETYFKIAAWSDVTCSWKAGKATYATQAEAEATAKKPGRYRVSRSDPAGWVEMEPFTV